MGDFRCSVISSERSNCCTCSQTSALYEAFSGVVFDSVDRDLWRVISSCSRAHAHASASRPKNMPPSQLMLPPQLASIQGRVRRQPNLHFRHGCLPCPASDKPFLLFISEKHSGTRGVELSGWGQRSYFGSDLCPQPRPLASVSVSLVLRSFDVICKERGCGSDSLQSHPELQNAESHLTVDVNGSFALFSCVSLAYVMWLFSLKHKTNCPVSVCARWESPWLSSCITRALWNLFYLYFFSPNYVFFFIL